MAAVLMLLRVLWPYLLGAVLLGGVWYKANYAWCNAACTKQSERARTAEGKIRVIEAALAEAQERAQAMKALWERQVALTEEANRKAEAARNANFNQLAQRSKPAAAGAAIRVPPASVSLWFDASSQANAASRAPGVGQAGPVTVPATADTIAVADLNAFVIEAARAYADAASQHQACLDWYGAIRATTLEKQP